MAGSWSSDPAPLSRTSPAGKLFRSMRIGFPDAAPILGVFKRTVTLLARWGEILGVAKSAGCGRSTRPTPCIGVREGAQGRDGCREAERPLSFGAVTSVGMSYGLVNRSPDRPPREVGQPPAPQVLGLAVYCGCAQSEPANAPGPGSKSATGERNLTSGHLLPRHATSPSAFHPVRSFGPRPDEPVGTRHKRICQRSAMRREQATGA